jgi:hypothetical protein
MRPWFDPQHHNNNTFNVIDHCNRM